MQNSGMKDIAAKICAARIAAVVGFEKEAEVSPVIEALQEGGVRVIELTLRSSYALKAVEYVKRKYPKLLLGVGTVINKQQVEHIAEIADFAVAPGLNRQIIETSQTRGLPFFPGIATASEIEKALEYDIRFLKFFPAEPLGGLKYLRSMNAPYAHLGMQYLPLGGVNQENMLNYLQSPIIGAVGGSWLAPNKLISTGNWKKIKELALEAMNAAKRLDGNE
ncbi:MAG: hypothetical protein B0D92_03715 [Spirochaeta sp. LUC14_002_19_P3]|nr:MAG: hypothetical protein B0D92_03715 [Spirochaeta sp. LUC14_002_19_P3]